jgi:predicted metal-dependent phosphoesterase TrpH
VRIDLHAHSTASDGTCTPAELVRAAVAADLDVVAITDHDTTAGWAEAEAALPPGLTLVRGAELSCRWYGGVERGYDPPIPLHLLAYLFDPADVRLTAELARVRQAREHRAERMVALLRADGIDVTWDEVRGYAAGGTVGRPHLAQALIRRGLVATTAAAFAPQWLGERYRLPKEDTDVFTALRLVRAAGGVAVFAHPRATKRGRVVPDELIVEMAGAGLAGLEADHEDHSPAQRAHVRALAADLGMVVTGSSDFHGMHKTVRLGAHTTDPDAYARIVAAASGVTPIAG